jgi:hypothetical protein
VIVCAAGSSSTEGSLATVSRDSGSPPRRISRRTALAAMLRTMPHSHWRSFPGSRKSLSRCHAAMNVSWAMSSEVPKAPQAL